jgi:hypothetical protein
MLQYLRFCVQMWNVVPYVRWENKHSDSTEIRILSQCVKNTDKVGRRRKELRRKESPIYYNFIMKVRYHESIKKIQTPKWNKPLLLMPLLCASYIMCDLIPTCSSWGLRHLILNECFAASSTYRSHFQLILVTLEQCTWHLLRIRLILLGSVGPGHLPASL